MRPAARLDRWRRRCGFDRNDLRRYVDRAQWRLGLALLGIFLVAAPVLGAPVAGAVHESGVRAERHGASAWRRVDATVVRVADSRGRHRVTVAWTGPDGTRRTGVHTTGRDRAEGERVAVWVGAGDTVSAVPPRTRAETRFAAAAAGAGAVAAVGAPLLGAYLLARRRYDRIRRGMWDAAWARFDDHRIGP
ncbi:Rv1733c family protein [Actinomadura sp. WAC 06369]|uniref:Rv1733c family protein n=1 Tax=Actinomadura sp. WAC 06369 TaxID=2203193 RepID=UPI000F78583C|nr:hypothetical protein [Actinomadura sp. WAC 06369]RSN70975.1 hypothetical protein DMH08_04025 [Actinomadura sp. WAC 06369]